MLLSNTNQNITSFSNRKHNACHIFSRIQERIALIYQTNGKVQLWFSFCLKLVQQMIDLTYLRPVLFSTDLSILSVTFFFTLSFILFFAFLAASDILPSLTFVFSVIAVGSVTALDEAALRNRFSLMRTKLE